MRRLALFLLLTVAAPALAQDRAQTLADIRQELTVLFVEVQKLKTELSTTGGPQVQSGGSTVLDRVNAMEAELSRLTSKTEQLEGRIDGIVRDGTNRIGDLEFRLVELEGGDTSKLGETSTLGGGALPTTAAAPTGGAASGGGAGSTGGTQLAVAEQADFDRAKAAYDAGDFAGAAGLFQSYTSTYSGGPLSGEAHFWRGEALAQTGDRTGAARAFLESFSGSPTGPFAPRALMRLGSSLGELGQVQEACMTLAEVGARFPGDPAAAEAQGRRQALGCQ